MQEIIINKVAESGLVTIDLEEYYPKEQTVMFDLKGYLFMGLILKEKDFREALRSTDWSIYQDKNVYITCTADAIIPMWANMLVVSYLQPVAVDVIHGDETDMHKHLFMKNLNKVEPNDFTDKRVVIKGCGEKAIPEIAYAEITRILRPVVKSLMYGEPCSTVPVYKKSKAPSVL